MDKEIRYTGGEILMREDDVQPMIEGYAIVFNEESRLLLDEGKVVREVIMPTAVDRELIEQSDICMTLFHNRESLLARSVNGIGTLDISIDDHGVKFRFAPPATEDGTKARELVKRADLRGCSFSYWSRPESVEYRREGKETIRVVNKIDYLSEMTIGSQPAYTQTSVSLRESVEHMDKEEERMAITEEVEREQEDDLEKAANIRKQIREIRDIIKK